MHKAVGHILLLGLTLVAALSAAESPYSGSAPEPVERLIQQLGDKDSKVREKATEALESLGAGAVLTHKNLFDGTVAGLRVRGRAIGSVQYHPEAGPGPNDATDLLAGFVDQVRRLKRERVAS